MKSQSHCLASNYALSTTLKENTTDMEPRNDRVQRRDPHDAPLLAMMMANQPWLALAVAVVFVALLQNWLFGTEG